MTPTLGTRQAWNVVWDATLRGATHSVRGTRAASNRSRRVLTFIADDFSTLGGLQARGTNGSRAQEAEGLELELTSCVQIEKVQHVQQRVVVSIRGATHRSGIDQRRVESQQVTRSEVVDAARQDRVESAAWGRRERLPHPPCDAVTEESADPRQ